MAKIKAENHHIRDKIKDKIGLDSKLSVTVTNEDTEQDTAYDLVINELGGYTYEKSNN